MPRITNQQYLNRHHILSEIWSRSPKCFGTLPFNRQLDVHLYFAPSKDWSDEDLIAHRRNITIEHPGLAQQASKYGRCVILIDEDRQTRTSTHDVPHPSRR